MKKQIIYIVLLLMLLVSSCSPEEAILPNHESGKKELTFSMFSTDFIPNTRAVDETIRRIDLLVFDQNGLFIEKVSATNINTTARTFKAVVDIHASIIHFVANYDALNSFDSAAQVGLHETLVIPPLKVTNNELVFWARNIITNIHQASVEFIRNQAKISVMNQFLNSSVSFVGFSVCNYNKAGTIASYVNNSFTYNPNVATVVTPVMASWTDANNADEKYICEYRNNTGQETYVILKFNYTTQVGQQTVTKPLFYKVFLRDANNIAYQIVRNVNYRIIIKKIPLVLGASTYESAIQSPPINSLYAEVMKDSPSISDTSGNSLTVSPLVHLVRSTTVIHSYIATSGSLGNIVCDIIDDPSAILSNLSFTNTGVQANVRAVTVQSEAKIRVKYGKLERIVSVIAAPQYQIVASTNRLTYNTYGTAIAYTFTLDTRYPLAADYPELYPIRCYINAPNLTPTDNKNMFIDFNYVTGQYWYVYIANQTGPHTINFKTNFNYVANDKITIQSQYFSSATITLNPVP